MPEVGSLRSEVGGRRSEVGSRKSESRKSECRLRKYPIRIWQFAFRIKFQFAFRISGQQPKSVVERDGHIAGTFLIRANQPDLGSHIANAAFMTSPTEGDKGIGSFMGEYALIEAKRLGYQAMQFNFVIKNNQRAIRLWLRLGFTIIGEIPEAFRHSTSGLTNALIMYKKL